MKLEGAVPAQALAAIRAPFLAADATQLNAAVVLPLSLVLDLAGETLRERLFVVQEPAGGESCLRPDFTLAAVLAHLASGAASGRYSYEGPAFRVAPAGAPRAEQFAQIGLEVFDTADAAEADAAMASLAWEAASAGGRDDLSLILGDIALFEAFLAAAIEVPHPPGHAPRPRLRQSGTPGERVGRRPGNRRSACGSPLAADGPAGSPQRG